MLGVANYYYDYTCVNQKGKFPKGLTPKDVAGVLGDIVDLALGPGFTFPRIKAHHNETLLHLRLERPQSVKSELKISTPHRIY